MPDTVVDSLVLDLLEWIGPSPRPYIEVLEAWRTSCPRLPVWEEATGRGLVVTLFAPDLGRVVAVSDAGRAHLGNSARCLPPTGSTGVA